MILIKGKGIKVHNSELLGTDFYDFKAYLSRGGHRELENNGERKFMESNPTFYHWPVTFYFSGTSYTPDFYVKETHTFYEIIGTATRYYQGQNKMLRVRRIFGARIILCNPEGIRLIPRFFKRGRSYLIYELKTIGSIPASEYCQDDHGQTTFKN